MVAEEYARRHLLVGRSPQIDVLATWCNTYHVDKTSSGPCPASEIGFRVPNPSVGLKEIIALKVDELLSTNPSSARWNVEVAEVNMLGSYVGSSVRSIILEVAIGRKPTDVGSLLSIAIVEDDVDRVGIEGPPFS